MSTSMYFLKLYMEILDDADVAILDDHTWRRFIEFLCIAKEQGLDGRLPDVAKIAWRLRTTDDDINQALKKLSSLSKDHARDKGLVYRDTKGWVITKFAERQGRMSPAEKQKRYRDRQREETLKKLAKEGNQATADWAMKELHDMEVGVAQP